MWLQVLGVHVYTVHPCPILGPPLTHMLQNYGLLAFKISHNFSWSRAQPKAGGNAAVQTRFLFSLPEIASK
jgi:hypothetical protein